MFPARQARPSKVRSALDRGAVGARTHEDSVGPGLESRGARVPGQLRRSLRGVHDRVLVRGVGVEDGVGAAADQHEREPRRRRPAPGCGAGDADARR
jgi:hypothetical protein